MRSKIIIAALLITTLFLMTSPAIANDDVDSNNDVNLQQTTVDEKAQDVKATSRSDRSRGDDRVGDVRRDRGRGDGPVQDKRRDGSREDVDSGADERVNVEEEEIVQLRDGDDLKLQMGNETVHVEAVAMTEDSLVLRVSPTKEEINNRRTMTREETSDLPPIRSIGRDDVRDRDTRRDSGRNSDRSGDTRRDRGR